MNIEKNNSQRGVQTICQKHKRKEECLQIRETQKGKFSGGRDRQRHPRLEGKQVPGLRTEE